MRHSKLALTVIFVLSHLVAGYAFSHTPCYSEQEDLDIAIA